MTMESSCHAALQNLSVLCTSETHNWPLIPGSHSESGLWLANDKLTLSLLTFICVQDRPSKHVLETERERDKSSRPSFKAYYVLRQVDWEQPLCKAILRKLCMLRKIHIRSERIRRTRPINMSCPCTGHEWKSSYIPLKRHYGSGHSN